MTLADNSNNALEAGELILELLSERKLSQVDTQFVIASVEKLLKSTVSKTIEKAKTMIVTEGFNNADVLDSIQCSEDHWRFKSKMI